MQTSSLPISRTALRFIIGVLLSSILPFGSLNTRRSEAKPRQRSKDENGAASQLYSYRSATLGSTRDARSAGK